MRRRFLKIFFLTLLMMTSVSFVSAQTAGPNSAENLQKQIQELLKQIESLQQQVAALKEELGTPAVPQAPPELTRSLSRGASGEDVRKLQEFLAGDKEVYPASLVTGYFGPLTEAAVKKWQEKNNLEGVGVVGPKTIAKFQEQRSAATVTPAIPAIPAVPATPAVPGLTPAVPATPAIPARPATTTPANTTPPTPVSGQAAPAWIRLLGGLQSDQAWGIARDNTNNIYIVGDTSAVLDGDTNNGLSDAFIAKYDTNGNNLWKRQMGSIYGDVFRAVTVDGANNVYAVGLTYASVDGLSHSGNTDALIAKYDYNGNKLWVREFGASLNDQLYGVVTDGSGNVYAAGLTESGLDGQTNSGLADALIIKYDSLGNKLWTRLLGSYTHDRAEGSIGVDSSGNVYIAGWTRTSLGDQIANGGEDAFLAKYDSAGQRIWVRQWGTADGDSALASAIGGGNVYVVGQTRGPLEFRSQQGDYDIFVSKFNQDGNRIWTKQLGTAGFDSATAVTTDSAGNAYVSGYVNGSMADQTNAGGSDAFVVKYDVDGNKIWTKLLGTPSSDASSGVAFDGVGNVLLSGYTSGALGGQRNAGQSDAFIAKYALVAPAPAAITEPIPSTTTTAPVPTTTTPAPTTTTAPTSTTTTTPTITAATTTTTTTAPTTNATTTSTTPTTTTTTATSVADTTAPSAPTGLAAYPATYSTAYSAWQITIHWQASTDNVGVSGYKIYRNSVLIASDPYGFNVSDPAYADIGTLAAGASYTYTVAAYDAAGNVSAQSAAISVTIPSPSTADVTPPAISNVQVTNITSSSATVSWVTDESSNSVIKYDTDSRMLAPRIKEVNDLVTAHSINLSGLIAGTTYYYFVLSIDSSNNHAYSPSGYGETKTFVTSTASAADTSAPSSSLAALLESLIISLQQLQQLLK